MQNQHQQQPGESHGNDKPKDINQAITQPQVLSSMPMSDWRGSVTTFNGFTGTRPARELEDASWDEVRNLLCPNKPAVLADKKQAQYVVPCLLKEAPFVGKTREAAISNWESATGKMRSKNHVTEANLIIMDIDGLPESEFLAGLKKLADDGLTYLIYTTHSHGSEDKPGIRARVVILLDRPLNVQEYSTAWQGIDRRYWNMQAGIADSSGANLYQQQGTWCCHPDRIEQAQSWTNDGGVASAEALLELGELFKSRLLSRSDLELGTLPMKTPTPAITANIRLLMPTKSRMHVSKLVISETPKALTKVNHYGVTALALLHTARMVTALAMTGVAVTWHMTKPKRQQKLLIA